eukprot:360718-Chlamydomonas_euryale.AAC.3
MSHADHLACGSIASVLTSACRALRSCAPAPRLATAPTAPAPRPASLPTACTLKPHAGIPVHDAAGPFPPSHAPVPRLFSTAQTDMHCALAIQVRLMGRLWGAGMACLKVTLFAPPTADASAASQPSVPTRAADLPPKKAYEDFAEAFAHLEMRDFVEVVGNRLQVRRGPAWAM